jgi:hypothetical protein
MTDPALLSALADAIRNAGATEEIVTALLEAGGSFGTIQSAFSSWAAGSVGLRHRWELATIAPGDIA